LAHRAEDWDFIIRDYPSSAYKRLNFENFSALRRIVVCFLALFAGCCSILQTGHITLSSTLDQQLENHSTKYDRQQPLYNTLELLMIDIVVPETC